MSKESAQTTRDKKYKCYAMMEGIALRLGLDPADYKTMEHLNKDIHNAIFNLVIKSNQLMANTTPIIEHDRLTLLDDNLAVALAIDDGACEGYPVRVSINLERLLAYIREEDPALYMKGVTTDMLRDYT